MTDICDNLQNSITTNYIYILYDKPIIIDNKIISVGSYFTNEEIIKLNNNKLDNIFLKVSFNELNNNKIVTHDNELVKIIDNLKQNNDKIILTCGCFDILHVGHMKLLKESKRIGGKLLVLLSSDEQIKYLKGPTRPINNLEDRINLFKNIPYIDYIIPYNELLTNNNEEILDFYINLIKPDIWTKGSEYDTTKILNLHPSLKTIKLINLEETKSTTNIVNKIINQHVENV